jgi:hypothetical protein
MRVVSQNFVAAGKPYYIRANAGVLYLDITDGKRYRQSTIPYGQNWIEIQKEQIFIPATGNGTVTSVGLAVPSLLNPAFGVSGSPVTTTGTLQLNLLGNNSQVILGDGTLAPLPVGGGTVTSVGLSMPAAFTVAGSPVTTTGTLAVSAAGNATEYIRGDGQLATFPTIPPATTVTGRAGDINIVTSGSNYEVQNAVLPFLLMGC